MTKGWEMREAATTVEVPTCLICGQPIRQITANSLLRARCECGCGSVWVGRCSMFSGSVMWDTIKRFDPAEVEAEEWRVEGWEDVSASKEQGPISQVPSHV